MTFRGHGVLNPVGNGPESREPAQVLPVEGLENKTIGLLSTFWPSYEPFVCGLERVLKEKFKVRSTLRLDYWRRPRLSDVWNDHKTWLDQVDAAVVGLGG